MRRRDRNLLIFILALFAFALYLVLPLDGVRFGREGLQLGLDLKGGTHLVYQADLSKKDPSQTDAQTMAALKSTIERRVNAYGVTEPIVQTQGTDRIIVQLPGVKDVDKAVKLIGEVAQLEFKLPQVDASGNPVTDPTTGQPAWAPATGTGLDGTVKPLTGQYLKPNTTVQVNTSNGQPEVLFNWNAEGSNLFKQITTASIGKPLGIFLDNQLISAPTVQAVITDSGVITGLTLDDARNLAIQLNSGTLNVPMTIIQQTDVDATLGSDSLAASLRAGLIGVALVMFFMIVYYKSVGAVAVAALLVYGTILLAIFKMIPVTLTLPGIAGFIISVGMAVDANVLIFERMKEEMFIGRTFEAGVSEGFRRAWLSIRDSNVSTIITCLILIWFGTTFGAFMVTGFAITLMLGVLVSMFSAITVTRTFLTALASTKGGRDVLHRGVK